MDAITDLCEEMGVAKIKKFMVAGASKRGWTTWTTVSIQLNVLYFNN
jgi:PhoPQ-activated pathogenicity-related protein